MKFASGENAELFLLSRKFILQRDKPCSELPVLIAQGGYIRILAIDCTKQAENKQSEHGGHGHACSNTPGQPSRTPGRSCRFFQASAYGGMRTRGESDLLHKLVFHARRRPGQRHTLWEQSGNRHQLVHQRSLFLGRRGKILLEATTLVARECSCGVEARLLDESFPFHYTSLS